MLSLTQSMIFNLDNHIIMLPFNRLNPDLRLFFSFLFFLFFL